jgi:hypothetical protein
MFTRTKSIAEADPVLTVFCHLIDKNWSVQSFTRIFATFGHASVAVKRVVQKLKACVPAGVWPARPAGRTQKKKVRAAGNKETHLPAARSPGNIPDKSL